MFRTATLRLSSKFCRGKAIIPKSVFQEYIVRNRSDIARNYYREIYRKRLRLGPNKYIARSARVEWNYEAEIFAFGKRLGEEIDEALLCQAFMFSSYVEEKIVDGAKSEEAENTRTLFPSNTDLIERGRCISSSFIPRYLRYTLPSAPEEVISACTNYLLSCDTIARVSSNLGTHDLIFCAEGKPTESVLADAFFAVIGALEKSQDRRHAEMFVLDFIIAQLIGIDLSLLWTPPNSLRTLDNILRVSGMPCADIRILRSTGQNSVLGVHVVGVYSDGRLLGESAGETSSVAKDLAIEDALYRLFGMHDTRQPFLFSDKVTSINFDEFANPNMSVSDYESGKHQISKEDFYLGFQKFTPSLAAIST